MVLSNLFSKVRQNFRNVYTAELRSDNGGDSIRDALWTLQLLTDPRHIELDWPKIEHFGGKQDVFFRTQIYPLICGRKPFLKQSKTNWMPTRGLNLRLPSTYGNTTVRYLPQGRGCGSGSWPKKIWKMHSRLFLTCVKIEVRSRCLRLYLSKTEQWTSSRSGLGLRLCHVSGDAVRVAFP